MNYFPNENLNGSVKNILEVRLEVWTRKNQVRKTLSKSSVSYDVYGNKVESISFDEAGGITGKMQAEYNEANQPVVRKFFYISDKLSVEEIYADSLLVETVEYNSDGSVRFKSGYLYDLRRRLIYFVRRKPDGTIFNRNEILYDRYGNRTEEELFDDYSRHADVSDNVKTAKNFDITIDALAPCIKRVKFDADNNPVGIFYYDCQNDLVKRYEIFYDLSGRVSEVDQYLNSMSSQHPELRVPAPLADWLLTLYAVYSYARDGDLNQALKSLLNAPLETKTTYQWDDDRLEAARGYFFGQFHSETNYSYGTRGELLRKLWRNADGSIFEDWNLTWKFDEQDNWVEYVLTEERPERRAKSGETTTKVNRNIEYYK